MIPNKISPFSYLLFILASVFIISPLFQQGLFIDGLLYKTVADNYFTGEGTFWKMKFNDVSMNPFYEQPPLFFFITGSFFKIFGNSFLTDKFVTLVFLCISAILVYKICKHFFSESKKAFQIVFFLLITIPVFCWSFVNQVIETMVLPLSLFAFYSFLQFRKKNIALTQVIYLFYFSAAIILLFLTKGFQSCFIIITPVLYFTFFKEKKSLVFGMVSFSIIAIILYLIIFINQPSKLWFDNYFQKRLMASLNNVGATTSYRAEIVIRTFTELIIPILLVTFAFIFLCFKKKIAFKNAEQNKNAWIILIIALFGSVPFCITLEQRGFYLVPSFPFFVIAITLFFQVYIFEVFQIVINFLNRKLVYYLLLFLLAGSLGYWIFSPAVYKRDKNLINDLKLIKPFVKIKDTLAIDSDTWNDAALQAYLYMNAKVNVECKYSHQYYIHDREHNTMPNTNYQKIKIPTMQYDFFVLKK